MARRAEDVLAFAKNEIAVYLVMEYFSAKGGLRTYRPDFIIRAPDAHYIVETRAWEDLEVTRTDLRATQRCRDATELSGQTWPY